MMNQVDRRIWMYREGDARIFTSPEDVPEGEGWQTHADFHAVKAAPVVEESTDNGDEENEKQYLRTKLKAAGEKVPPRAGLDWMRDKADELGMEID